MLFTSISIARLYSEVIFNLAIEQNSLKKWYDMLSFLSEITSDSQLVKILSNNYLPHGLLSEIIISACGNYLDTFCSNFIKIMSKNKHLAILPLVFKLFTKLYNSHNKLVIVDVISANIISLEQLDKIYTNIKRILPSASDIKINTKIDSSIISGIVIHIDDMVIDGSILNLTKRLTSSII